MNLSAADSLGKIEDGSIIVTGFSVADSGVESMSLRVIRWNLSSEVECP